MNKSTDTSLPLIASTDTEHQPASSADLVEIGSESLQQVAGGQGGTAHGDPR
jgi:hypothetical protein